MYPTISEQGALNSQAATVPPTDSAGANGAQDAPYGQGAALPTESAPGAGDGQGQETAHEESIPYERFKQLNERAQQLEAELNQWKPVIEQARTVGYQDANAVLAAARQAERAQVENQLDAQLRQQIDQGELTPEQAERYFAAEMDRWQLRQELANLQQGRVSQELEQARRDYPSMDEEYVLGLAQAGRGSVLSLAKASHEKMQARIQAELANHNAKRQELAGRPVPVGSGGGPAGASRIPDPGTPEWDVYYKGVLKSFSGR